MSKEKSQALGFDLPRLARVGHTIKREIEAGKYHGASMIVSRQGTVVLELVEGDADRQTGRRLGPDAVFSTMSIAKQFTNVLALSLVERGALRLHMPIAEWLPEFRAMGHEKINLAHLLTHTSGICSAIPSLPPEVIGNIEQLTAYAASRQLESMPGERVNYSILVGHSVIAALCLRADGRGRTYMQMLNEELFAPLKMHDSGLGLRRDLEARFCPVKAAWSGSGVIPAEAVEGMNDFLRMPGAEVPGGGCVTSIGDLHRFAEMLRRGGELDGARILSPATIDYASRNQTGALRNVLFDPFLSTRNWLPIPAFLGLGFFLRGEGVIPGPFGNLNSSRSFGGFGAGSTAFWVDPERELSFAFLSTGLIEDSYHMERIGLLSDLVLAAMVE
jgi:CubicO group peptidase (beta-lactamase class C family)